MKKLLALALMLLSAAAMAKVEPGENSTNQMYLGYFIGMGIAVLGGTLAQSRAAAAALEGIARNPGASNKVFTPMILAFALMESLVIFMMISIFLV